VTFDDIVKVCADFFREDAIMEARCVGWWIQFWSP